MERARDEIAQLDSQLRQLREPRKEEVERQKEKLERLLKCIKQEVQRKYHEELRVLGQTVVDLKARLNDLLLTKEKEVKQLHL